MKFRPIRIGSRKRKYKKKENVKIQKNSRMTEYLIPAIGLVNRLFVSACDEMQE